ncbi:hypothetical protein QE368_000023 [Asaia bogorensis NBRC 16594]|nr:hypothetical protein [Asaia bogorensis NBRC 16594]
MVCRAPGTPPDREIGDATAGLLAHGPGCPALPPPSRHGHQWAATAMIYHLQLRGQRRTDAHGTNLLPFSPLARHRRSFPSSFAKGDAKPGEDRATRAFTL